MVSPILAAHSDEWPVRADVNDLGIGAVAHRDDDPIAVAGGNKINRALDRAKVCDRRPLLSRRSCPELVPKSWSRKPTGSDRNAGKGRPTGVGHAPGSIVTK
jgi:hypothetical protein